MSIYLDAAAAHPVRPSARRAFLRALSHSGNPSSPHKEGRTALDILENARARIARILGAKADMVIFTSGATEANALAIVGHIRARIEAGSTPASLTVLYVPTQHASVLGAVEEVKKLGVHATPIPLVDGAIDMDALRALLKNPVTLITLDVVCGETGTRFDTRGVRACIDELPTPERPVFHVDATQAPLVENMERTRLGADLISFDAQKIGGIRGIGVLLSPRTIPLVPLFEGGGQERGLRSGTPSPALATALENALTSATREREAFARRAEKYITTLVSLLQKEVPGTLVNGGRKRAPHIVNVSLPQCDAEYLSALLDARGICVSTKSACESGEAGSRVVALYTGSVERATSALRISMHAQTRLNDLHECVRVIKKVLPLARA